MEPPERLSEKRAAAAPYAAPTAARRPPDAAAPAPARAPGRALRVAVVTTVHRWGDPRIFERETAAWLEWGCDVHVFVPATSPPERSGWSEDRRLTVHTLPPPAGRSARIGLALGVGGRVEQNGPFDLVHFHDPELIPAMAGLAARWPRTYFLYDIHEELPLEVMSKPWIPTPLRGPISFLSRALWGVAGLAFEGFAPATEAIARHWPASRTRLVHNYPKAVFELPAGQAPSPDPDRVVFVGALTEVRGIRTMLAAVREVRRRRQALALELYGPVSDASLAPEVAQAVSEGWCAHSAWEEPGRLARLCRGAGVGLLPYLPVPDHLEALPTKFFEYMAMGIPVLASDFPLWRGILAASGAGRVAAPVPEAYAAALGALLADPAALSAHALRGLEAYRSSYRWETERENLRWHLDRAREQARA